MSRARWWCLSCKAPVNYEDSSCAQVHRWQVVSDTSMETLMRMKAKRDDNEADIVKALRATGCLVEFISGTGIPDLLVWSPFRKCVVLLEVKDGSKEPARRRLRPEQLAFHTAWSANGAPVYVVESVEQALSKVQ